MPFLEGECDVRTVLHYRAASGNWSEAVRLLDGLMQTSPGKRVTTGAVAVGTTATQITSRMILCRRSRHTAREATAPDSPSRRGHSKRIRSKRKADLERQPIHSWPIQREFIQDPPGSPIADVVKSNAYQMEAFASDSHIGMIYTANTSQGQDRIIEAKCEACGTTKSLQSYRGQSAYEGAQRTGWTPECYPQCV